MRKIYFYFSTQLLSRLLFRLHFINNRVIWFVPGDKYEAVSMDSGYKKYMMLKIRNVGVSDFGSYKCVAKNSLGETDGVIKLEGITQVWRNSCTNFVRVFRDFHELLQCTLRVSEIPAPTTIRTTTQIPLVTTKRRGEKSNILISITSRY